MSKKLTSSSISPEPRIALDQTIEASPSSKFRRLFRIGTSNQVVPVDGNSSVGLSSSFSGQPVSISSKIGEESHSRRRLAKSEKKNGGDHPETIAAVDSLAKLLCSIHKENEAQDLYERELYWKEKNLGKENLETIKTLHELGFVLSKIGKHEDASNRLSRALHLREKIQGEDHEDTMSILADLALVKSKQNKYNEAEGLHRRLLNWHEKKFGMQSVHTLDATEDLAQCLQSSSKFSEANELYNRVLIGREKSQGPSHPLTLLTVTHIASLLFDQGHFEKAEAHYRRALRGMEDSEDAGLGPDHPATLTVIHEMGRTLEHLGNNDSAIEMFRRAVDGRERTLGANHPDTIESALRLSSLFEKMEDIESPREETPRDGSRLGSSPKSVADSESGVMKLAEESSPSSPRKEVFIEPSKLETVSAVCKEWPVYYHESEITGVGYPSKMEFEEEGITKVEADCRNALDAKLKTGEGYDDKLIAIIDELATVLHAQKKLKDAEQVYRRSFLVREALYGDNDNMAAVDILNGFAALLQQRRSLVEAERTYRRIIRSCSRLYGADHTNTIFALVNLAGVLRRQQKYVDAERAYAQAMKGYEKSLGPDHPFSLAAANDMAVQMARQKKHAEAQEIFERVLIGRERALGMDHPDTLAVCGNIAVVLHIQEKTRGVSEMYRRALKGNKDNSSPLNKEELAGITNNFADYLRSQGLMSQAVALYREISGSRLLINRNYLPKHDMLVLKFAVGNLISYYREQKKTGEVAHLIKQFDLLMGMKEKDEFEEDEEEHEDLKAHLKDTGPQLPPFPKQGVSLKLMRRIKELSDPSWSTDDVNKNLIMPWTKELRCSFVEYMQREYTSTKHPQLQLSYEECFVDKATIFVSHAWRYKYSNLLEAIETFFVDQIDVSGIDYNNTVSRMTEVNTFLWVDLFVNDQWNAPQLPYEWWSGTFLSAIGEIGHSLLVLCPWNAPIPLTRAWCLWEILSTIRTDSRLTVQLSLENRYDFQKQFELDESCLLKAFSQIDVEKSQAFLPADRDMIFEAVRKAPGGFRGVNNLIMDKLRAWAISSVQSMVDDPFHSLGNSESLHSPRQEADLLKVLRNKILLAGIYHVQNKCDEAELLYVEVLRGYDQLLPPDDPEVLRLLVKLAALYKSQNKDSQATDLYVRIYRKFKAKLGNDHPDSLRIRSNIAGLLRKRQMFKEAEETYEEILQKFKKKLPADHADILQTYRSIGSLYCDQGRCEDAQLMFRAALEGYERSPAFGYDHPETLKTVHNIAIVLQNLKLFEDADAHYTRALLGLERVLGPKHPETVKVASNAAALRSYFFKNPFCNFSQNSSNA